MQASMVAPQPILSPFPNPLHLTSSFSAVSLKFSPQSLTLSRSASKPLAIVAAPTEQYVGGVIVIMGVSGAGKTTIGQLLEKEMRYDYLDADDFHSESNKEKMHMGIPLTDEDRKPWLESLRDAIRSCLVNKNGLVLGCSALKNQYREILRSGDPDYELGSYTSAVNFVLLDAPAEVLSLRLNKRAAEGKHYMPASLLQSQLDLLKIDESEGILRVDATLSPQSIVNNIQRNIFLDNQNVLSEIKCQNNVI